MPENIKSLVDVLYDKLMKMEYYADGKFRDDLYETLKNKITWRCKSPEEYQEAVKYVREKVGG